MKRNAHTDMCFILKVISGGALTVSTPQVFTVDVPVTATCTVRRPGSGVPEEERLAAAHARRLWGKGGGRKEVY